jgi:hypothetical protein
VTPQFGRLSCRGHQFGSAVRWHFKRDETVGGRTETDETAETDRITGTRGRERPHSHADQRTHSEGELETKEAELKDRQATVMIGLDTRRQTIPGELSPTYPPVEGISTAL